MRRFLLALLIASLATAHAADRPNILLIVSEDNGSELGCYGEPVVRTPVLDQLAEGGVLFERADVPQAGCRLLGICFWAWRP
jgi:N-sulfoglucosamine sulfohydrolase